MTATLSDVADALARANCNPTRHGDGYVALCPVHEADGHGHKPSLSISTGDKVAVVLHCHAGCEPASIFKALGIGTSGKAGAAGRRIIATYRYHDASGAAVFEKVRYEPKGFCIRQRPASGGAFVYKIPRGIEPPLYRLPALTAAVAAGDTVYLVEGEKDADRLAAAGLCATTNYEGAAADSQKPKWRTRYTAALAGADVCLIPDNDEPGRAHMRHIAAALAGTAQVRWLELPGLPAKGDVSDWLNAGHTVDELEALAANATTSSGTTTAANGGDAGGGDTGSGDDAEIARLAALNLLDYDRQRGAAAKALGIRGDTLDKLVKHARGEPADTSNGGGSTLTFPDVQPWPQPVCGAELLDALAASVRRFLSLPEHAAPAIALWTAYSFVVVNHGHIAPCLAITSPEKRCGKSTLLGWLYRLVDKPLLAANITAAAIFRTVDAFHPTLLIDEADSFLGETGDELRGILNSGHTRDTAYVIRVCGEELEPRKFSTWGAKAVALIGKLEGRYATLADRSIEIQLRRRLPTDTVEKLRHADDDEFAALASQCLRFALDHGAALGKARPDIPDSLHDRAADNWEPLLAIADKAGGGWPRLARTAAMALTGTVADGGGGIGVQLLTDLQRYFADGNATSHPTEELLQYLTGIEEAPWNSYTKSGKAMTARHLARLLHPYGILPQNIRVGNTVPKGYNVSDFADAFARYLPSIRYTATSQSNSGETPDCVSATDSTCSGYAPASSASQQAACSGVADKKPVAAAAGAGVADDVADDWL